jgi:hypothetical protein
MNAKLESLNDHDAMKEKFDVITLFKAIKDLIY